MLFPRFIIECLRQGREDGALKEAVWQSCQRGTTACRRVLAVFAYDAKRFDALSQLVRPFWQSAITILLRTPSQDGREIVAKSASGRAEGVQTRSDDFI
jgi:hypothetical protein